MRALSLTQPWAWLVVHGGKDIENRTWNTKFRGEFLIHAAKGMKGSDFDAAWAMARGFDQNLAWRMLDVKNGPAFERGGIVGVAEIFDVIAPTSVPHIQWSMRWHMREQYGFRLANVRPLPFLPCKGSLGFWGNFEIRDGQAVQL